MPKIVDLIIVSKMYFLLDFRLTKMGRSEGVAASNALNHPDGLHRDQVSQECKRLHSACDI